ncbi:uncharacterized protein [Lolium perenne]|uniref:uncharacterized protein n=1 Tax=Lolium perenne TaxID=4522 RepID=UPI0021F4FFC1|nr:uncharacterized protein LOC127303491 [Lolium perenne]
MTHPYGGPSPTCQNQPSGRRFSSQETANAILQTPITDADGQDILVWKLTPTCLHSPKSAYKHCYNNLQLPPRQRPKIIPQQVISLLNQVWDDKEMAPRIQTFAWRLLRKALPTGKPTCLCRCLQQLMPLSRQPKQRFLATLITTSKSSLQIAHNNLHRLLRFRTLNFQQGMPFSATLHGRSKEIQQRVKAGLGVIIHFQENQHLRQLQVSALSPPISSPLHAETYGLLLATKLADLLQVQDPRFYTDCAVLVSAATTASVFATQRHWEIRPERAAIRSSPSFRCNNISHINRSTNIKAHHHARLALRIQSLAVCCLSDDTRHCPSRDVLSVSSVTPFTLLSVKCS